MTTNNKSFYSLMDLATLLPEAMTAIAPARNVALWTHGAVQNGSLEHIETWSSSIGETAYFGLLPFSPLPVGSRAAYPLVSCTFADVLRDCWLRRYVIVVRWRDTRDYWQERIVFDCYLLKDEFDTLLGHVRGFARQPVHEIARVKQRVLESVAMAGLVFQGIQLEDRLPLRFNMPPFPSSGIIGRKAE